MRKLFLGFLLSFLFLGWIEVCWGLPTVSVGQQVTLTDFNYHQTEFSQDPANNLPLLASRFADSSGSTAQVYLSANAQEAGVAQSWIGVNFDWDLGGYTWDQVKYSPVRIAVDLSYVIFTNWKEGTGSANAGINIERLTDPWYDFIGFETGESGARSGTLVETFDQTFDGRPLTIAELNDAWGNAVVIQAYAQAHRAEVPDGGSPNDSLASTRLDSITIESNLLSPVPEPSTVLLLGTGLVGLAGLKRKFRE